MMKSGNLIPHMILTPMLNRHYVSPALRNGLIEVADELNHKDQTVKVSYLDANFPFMDGFPLLPHLSHDDGRKIDLSFYYKNDEKPVLDKPSFSGYGTFVQPKAGESNQTQICKSSGYRQYDFTKYLTLGSRAGLVFDENGTRLLISTILRKMNVQKILIEPHLKNRMNLSSDKIRFHGCHAVRHDDHIHLQVN